MAIELRCIAIDDEPLSLRLIHDFCLRISELNLIRTFDDPRAGLDFLKSQPIDLLLIDINMPDLNGLDLVNRLEFKPMVIFITAHKKFAIEGFELDAIDYLLKPVSFERFQKAISKAIEFANYRKLAADQSADHLFVRSEYQQVKVSLDDIDYIESIQDYVKIHLRFGKPVLTLITMKKMAEKLPAEKFLRIHRSYLVPVKSVQSISNRKVRLSNIELPIGESYLSDVTERLKL